MASRSKLLASLETATLEHPLERKLLVCTSRLQGTELLRALSASGTGWLGWEVATPFRLALEIAGVSEAVVDEFTVARLIDEAIDDVIARGSSELREATTSAQFRGAVHRAIILLRSTGRSVEPALARDAILRATLQVLACYEQRLRHEQRCDHADVLRLALDRLRANPGVLNGTPTFIVPAVRFGLRGELLSELLAHGAELLSADSVHGLESPSRLLRSEPSGSPAARRPGSPLAQAPTRPTGLSYLHAPDQHDGADCTIHLFAAATPMDELREVLRRVIERRIPWDQVEIVATDARGYGNALYALARRLGVPLTLSNGVDLARTRTGRALRAYLAWVRDSYPAETLRAMLECGDLAGAEHAGPTATRLAYRLRKLRIGWGKDRYFEVIDRALKAALEPAAPNDEQDAVEADRARERERAELRALRDLVLPILRAAPAAPARLQVTDFAIEPAQIARGVLVFLDLVPQADESDAFLRSLLRERLQRAAAELRRAVPWATAFAIVERAIDLRVRPEEDAAGGWTAAPGRLHLSDLRTGGFCARPYTFVVGLDASRVAATAGVDPILTDPARREVLGLPTVRERAALRRFELAELLARLRGEVTLSFSAWDATEGRAVPPAMELLQALRLQRRDARLTYRELHEHLGQLAAAVPLHAGRVDGSDVWLGALSSGGGILHSATALVEAAYPHLRRGQLARQTREAARFSEYHGVLNRSASTARTFSATQLETLGTCPRRYLYRYLFRMEVPDVIDYDPGQWLDPRERGSLLHRTFEQTLERARHRGVEYHEREFWNLARTALIESVEKTRDRLPPPGEEVFQRELHELAEDLRRFVRMVRRNRPRWVALEQRFGEPEPFIIDTALGPVRLRGAIDRVDEDDDGRLVVIDYKTGRKYGYWPARPFNGGRRIQHVVYSLAAARLHGREVARMEYHFPTARGESELAVYFPRQLGSAEHALARLMRLASGNVFAATDDPRDCRICDFASVCRVQIDPFGAVTSPRATWCREHGLELPEAEPLRILRRVDG